MMKKGFNNNKFLAKLSNHGERHLFMFVGNNILSLVEIISAFFHLNLIILSHIKETGNVRSYFNF